MTVIVNYDDKGNPTFRSSKGLGSSDEDRENARTLDKLILAKLGLLKSKLQKNKIIGTKSKANVEAYWELGLVLRDILNNSFLVDPSEKSLFWLNVNMRLPEELKAQDRGPNRIHVEYCYRLSGIDKKMALLLNWGEWVFLFDSPTINKEHRFDVWFSKKLIDNKRLLQRQDIRHFVQHLNSMLEKLETSDLQDDQLFRCYEVAWELQKNWKTKPSNVDDEPLKSLLKKSISAHRTDFVMLVTGDMSASEYVGTIWNHAIGKSS
jgi:hypothetical protein